MLGDNDMESLVTDTLIESLEIVGLLLTVRDLLTETDSVSCSFFPNSFKVGFYS